MNIGVVGLSHQGLVYSSFLAKNNHNIIGIDSDKNLIKNLKTRYYSEDTKVEPFIKTNLRKFKKKILFSNNFKKISNCDFIFITQDVKILNDGKKDEKKVFDLIKTVSKYAKINSNFIILSQVKVGFANKIVQYLERKRRKLNIFNSPDILTIGQALNDLERKKILIVGHEDRAVKYKQKVKYFFKKINKKILFTSLNTVEITKEAVQLKLALDVTFVNLLSDFCKKNNSDTYNVINYMKLDSRFSKRGYWRPGLGFGGGHIERGLKTFDKNLNSNYQNLIKKVIIYNDKRIDYFVNNMESEFKRIKNLKLGILGLSYKKNSESTFRSYAVRFLKKLKKQKNKIFAYDPSAKLSKSFQKKFNIKQVSKLNVVLGKSNTLLVLCDWDQFKKIDLITLVENKISLIIDPFNIFQKMKLKLSKLNINYINL